MNPNGSVAFFDQQFQQQVRDQEFKLEALDGAEDEFVKGLEDIAVEIQEAIGKKDA